VAHTTPAVGDYEETGEAGDKEPFSTDAATPITW
jgi:hypothetical protein